ncbi:MAG: Rrf2 family transcriptional regulator [Dehalococcoidia bacterium]|nr:Rrf2 family transcriptional regulator [Dehalococcoidia bacterium]
MKLTRSTDFALRVLLSLAGSDRKVTNGELSRTLNLSPHHLYKIVQVLSRQGYLRTLPGRGGGVVLGRPPEEVSLLEVIELMEGPISLTDCLVNLEGCCLSRNCLLKGKMEMAQERMRDVFRSTTIRDLVGEKGRMG